MAEQLERNEDQLQRLREQLAEQQVETRKRDAEVSFYAEQTNKLKQQLSELQTENDTLHRELKNLTSVLEEKDEIAADI